MAEYDKVTGTVPVAAGPDVMLQFQDSFSTPGPGHHQGSEPPSSRWGFLSVGFYRPYFDVDTVDVLDRIRDSLLPYPRSAFLEKTSLNPDMYGPFWICTTLIFLTAAFGNLSGYLSHKTGASGHDKWYYDITKVSSATGIFYGYAAIVPAGLYFLLKYLNISAGLVQLWCLYGYSLFVFIPTSFVSVIPLEIVRWVIVLAATVLSATFLATNLRAQLMANHDSWLVIVGICVFLQIGLGIVLKLYFFTYFNSGPASHIPAT
eukprot:jgi/Mesen1/10690/ME000009S10480